MFWIGYVAADGSKFISLSYSISAVIPANYGVSFCFWSEPIIPVWLC